jgi:hypothetical protein
MQTLSARLQKVHKRSLVFLLKKHQRVTGAQTFIVSYSRIVYQKDMDPNKANTAAEMKP